MNTTVAIDSNLKALAATYRGPSGRVNPTFTRKLRQLPEDEQHVVILQVEKLKLCEKGAIQIVGTVIQSSGFSGSAPIARASSASQSNTERAGKVCWTDVEWDRLLVVLRELRRTKPGPNIAQLLPEAQNIANFPEHRRRKNIVPMKSVIDKLTEHEKKITSGKSRRELEDDVELLKLELEERPTKEELLSSLTEADMKPFLPRLLSNLSMGQFLAAFSTDEILRHIPTAKLIPAVAGIFAEGIAALGGTMTTIAAALDQNKAPAIHHHNGNNNGSNGNSNDNETRITVIGPNHDQAHKLRQVFMGRAKINVIDKQQGKSNKITKDQIPSSSDIVVLWSKFANHADRNAIKAKQRSSSFFYRDTPPELGMEGLIRFIEDVMEECSLALVSA